MTRLIKQYRFPALFRLNFLFTGILSIIFLAGCGGSGGSGTEPVTTKKVTISTTGITSQIYGVSLEATLPQGITLKTKSDNSIADGVVILSAYANGSALVSTYTPTGATSRVNISIAKSSPFDPGEIVTIICTVAAGKSLVADDISLTDFKVYDENFAEIPGVKGVVSVD